MPDKNRKSAVVPIHVTTHAKDQDRRTFICIGVPRGGTSAVGGTMQHLGIFMGDNLTNNYEDGEFIGKGISHMKSVISKRNSEKKLWGWKCPDAVNYLDELLPFVENPHLIVVFRDVVATLKGHIRWHNRDQMRAAHEVLIQIQRNWFLVERWKIPTALVSYEKLIISPNIFIHDMADFMSVPLPAPDIQGEICAFLKPGSYK